MNIKINTKSDERISSLFPNDPYSNLCIITTSQRLYLQQAFLAVDSEFFESIEPDTREINFSQWKQQPLIKVLHSLYGETLIANTILQLSEIYEIIKKLEISDYKNNLLEEVKTRSQILENIQFLQFSYKNNICFEQVVQIHMSNKLRLLEETKNYLQLNKLQNQTFNIIILQYLKRYGESNCKVVNNVMENYFNRKNIKAVNYLKSFGLNQLLNIWLKYHHISASQLFIPKSSPNINTDDQVRSRHQTQTFPDRQPKSKVIAQKKKKLVQLQQTLASKDDIIRNLTQQIQQLKLQIGLNIHNKAITAKSFIINVDNEQLKEELKKMKSAEYHEYHYSQDKGDYNTGPKQIKASKSKKTLDELYQSKSTLNRFGSRNFKKY